MKNFRKVLALVLVVATLFSFASVAGAKTLADYKDADKVTTENYEVAVDVLSALEILNGYEDETFKPTNTITRAEMAKMIAVLSNAGDDNVDKLYAAACDFADVDKVNDWFASYVSYCAYTGIVAGRSADTFDPYGKVTGLETAKMLLVTMGFSAEEQGYVGANWKINVLRDAQNFGLLDGFAAGYDVDAAITREEAANMMLNALVAPVVVGVLSDNIVKITNALYRVWGVEATLIDANHNGWVAMYGNVIVDDDTTLAAALYNNRLTIEGDRDCYGRPGSYWTLVNTKGTTVFEGKFVTNSLFASDYTGEIDLFDVLEEEIALEWYDLEVYVDGEDVEFYENVTEDDEETIEEEIVDEYIGKGVLVEVYVDDAEDLITVVIVNTYFGEVTAVLKASDRFVVGFVGIDENGDEDIVEYGCYSNKEYGFEEGDMILYWLCGWNEDGYAEELHDAQVVEPTTAGITRAELSENDDVDDTFTADGKVYEKAFSMKWSVDDIEVILTKDFEQTFDIYTDLYGYVVDVLLHEDEEELFYAYVVEGSGKANHLETLGDNTIEYTAVKTFVDFEAKTTENTPVVAIPERLDVFEEDIWFTTLGADVGSLIEYTIDDDGRAVAERYADTAGQEVILTEDGDLYDTVDDAILFYGNDDTKYLVRTWDYENGEYKYTAYTEDELPSGFAGYKTIRAEKGDRFLTPVNSIQYFWEEVGSTTDKQKTNVLTYVFIDAQYALEANRALVMDNYKLVYDSKFIDQVYAVRYYEAVVNGVASYLLLTLEEAEGLNLEEAPILVETELTVVGLEDNGYPVYAIANAAEVNVEEPVEFVGGELLYNGASMEMEEDFFAVVVDPEGNANVYTDAAELNKVIESARAIFHKNSCTDVDSDEICLCQTYAWVKGWIVTGNDSDVDELYVVLDAVCGDNCEDEA